ncbi:hypothetical protein HZD82_28215, partial [Pantoea agglomerans]|nr:hypothetical protein [Pantoea agglomerans]
NYQYRAFGTPELGLKRGLNDNHVVAPYATLLALMVLLQEAKVCVSPGIGFGDYGDTHVRFALIENSDRIRQAVRG